MRSRNADTPGALSLCLFAVWKCCQRGAHRSERFSRCVSSPFFREPCPVSSCGAGGVSTATSQPRAGAHRFPVRVHGRAQASCHGLHHLPHPALDVRHRVDAQRFRSLECQAAHRPDGKHTAPEHSARGCAGVSPGAAPAGCWGARLRSGRRRRRSCPSCTTESATEGSARWGGRAEALPSISFSPAFTSKSDAPETAGSAAIHLRGGGERQGAAGGAGGRSRAARAEG